MRREELEALTKQQILEIARELDLPGRSGLSKDGLIRALLKVQSRSRKPIFGSRKKTARKATAPPARSARPTKKPAAETKRAAGRRADASAPAGRTKATTRKPAGATAAGRPRGKRQMGAKDLEKVVAKTRASGPTGGEPTRKVKPGSRKRTKVSPKASDERAKTAARRAAPPTEVETPESGVTRGPVRRTTPSGAPLQMPHRYGVDQIALMARDPYWLHAYWEVTDRSVGRLRAKLGKAWEGSRAVLRVYDYPPDIEESRATSDNGEDRYDIDLPPGSENWYINVGRADRAYRVAVGVIDRKGRFHAYARSNLVSTPRDSVSPITDEEWAVSPEAFTRLYEMAAPAEHLGGRSSAELGMLLRERLRSDWSSGMLASMGSGELAAQKPAGRGFWFVVDAELIIYGATEADATVTVQGRPVKLRPDGTFSLRFQLPDGTQVIDATAVSADKVFRKTITPTVRRETRATEMIETDERQRS